ncbi:hypothetical protein ACPPVW_06280 [Leifsonia sp. McL0607]|uniref:hypothetical protein n=1 Tax=Leifsonia sp. McL0607 TaxID=3415672 RepID=UPI003CF56877
MTNIDDSNTTPPGYWFGELNRRLRDRMRDELHDLGLGRRGWRILHTLADRPTTPEDLAATLPRHGHAGPPDPGERHDGPGADRRNPEGDREGADPGTDRGTGSAAASGRREWRGHPDWMRREWERRQEMYRAWMEHDRQHPHPDPRDHHEHGVEHEQEHGHDHEHDAGHEHDHEHDAGHKHEHEHGRGDDHDAHPEHDHHGEHDHEHGPRSGGHGSQQAFERGFERGFVRGFERGTPFGPGRFGPGGFGPGGFGPGRFGHGPYGQGHGNGYGHGYGYGFSPVYGHAPFSGRGGCHEHIRAGVDRVLADFVERGWVWFDGDTATLTDEGRAAHDAAFERIRALRASVSEGIDPADLATTLATLEAMARNLGWTPPADALDSEAPGTEAPAEQTPSSDGEARSDDPATD